MGRTIEDVFREFHQVDPTEKVKVKVLKTPKGGAVLGRLESFVYTTISEGSSREGTHFEHEVGDLGSSKTDTEIWVIADSDGKIFFVTVHNGGGGRYPNVTERGIVG